MAVQRISTEGICRRGEEIHQSRLRARFDTAENRGKFLAIDVESGKCELDAEVLQATERLHARRPQGKLFALRIGYDAEYETGASSRNAL